jgi:hypothetical protein
MRVVALSPLEFTSANHSSAIQHGIRVKTDVFVTEDILSVLKTMSRLLAETSLLQSIKALAGLESTYQIQTESFVGQVDGSILRMQGYPQNHALLLGASCQPA